MGEFTYNTTHRSIETIIFNIYIRRHASTGNSFRYNMLQFQRDSRSIKACRTYNTTDSNRSHLRFCYGRRSTFCLICNIDRRSIIHYAVFGSKHGGSNKASDRSRYEKVTRLFRIIPTINRN